MKRVFCDAPDIVIEALKDQMPDVLFCAESDADFIYKPKLPEKLSNLISDIYKLQNDTIGGLSFCPIKKTISNNKAELTLTEKEFEIISLLKTNQFSKQDLLKNVWGYSDGADTNTVETHIYRLRQKLTDSFGFPLIMTKGDKYYI